MKIATRLTWVLLFCVVPVLAVYMLVSIHQTTHGYIEQMTLEARATTRALVDSVRLEIAEEDWSDIRGLFEQVHTDQVAAAIFAPDGAPMLMLPDFPIHPSPPLDRLKPALGGKPVEFVWSAGGRPWLCRGVGLSVHGKPTAILLVAVDWTSVRNDLSRRVAASVLTGIVGVGLIVLIIPVAIRYYVGRPLAELSRRVTRFSGDDVAGTSPSDEVELLTEEFRRLDCQLKTARDNLLKENERKLDLERRLRHSDKLATIGTLASGLAHEIGTPLNIIRGRAEHLLRARENPHKTAEGLETIINQIDRITRIVRMLLDFGGRRERLRSPRDIRQIVQSTVCLLETEARRRGVEFDVALGDAPLIVSCNSDQLQQVFVNLGVNALDAMAEHGGKLRIGAERSAEDGQERVRLVFEDTGPGIADEYRERVFNPFFTTKDPGRGTGMGLAVSQSIIREHEGEIVAEAHTGGARLAVTLPLLPASGRADRVESA